MSLKQDGNSADRLTCHYEELRAQVVGMRPVVAVSQGLALLLRAGMPTWISAWLHYPPGITHDVERAQDRRERLPSIGPRAEVATVLVDMVLSAQRRRWGCGA